jgi:ferrous iron transport protein A
MMNSATMPLAIAGQGDRVTVVAITAGHAQQMRLADLGIVAGKVLEVVQRQDGGDMVVAVGDTRLALGCGMTQKICVSPITDEVTG